MKNFLLSLFVIIIINPAILFSQNLKSGAEVKINIGAILPLTGDGASFGVAERNGINLALSKLDKDTREKINILIEDDGFLPKNTVSAAKKLMATNKITTFITFSSSTSKALSPITEQAKIPFIAIATDPEVSKNKKYAVNFWVTPETEVSLLIPEAVKRGYKKIARVTSDQAGMQALKKTFIQL